MKKQPKLTRPRHPLGPRLSDQGWAYAQRVSDRQRKQHQRSTHSWLGGRVVAYPNDYNDVGLLVKLPFGLRLTFYVCRTPWDGPMETIALESGSFTHDSFRMVKLTFTHR